MATNNVPNVNAPLLNATVLDTQESLKDQREEEIRRARQKGMASDFKAIGKEGVGVADPAEPAAPPMRAANGHADPQKTRAHLQKALVEAGGKGPNGEEIESLATDQLEKIQDRIDALLEKGASQKQIRELEAKKEALGKALEEYQATDAEVEFAEGREGQPGLTVFSADQVAPGEARKTTEEMRFWEQWDAELKTAGIDRQGGTDIEKIQKDFLREMDAEATRLRSEETELKKKSEELQGRLKSASDPEAKAGLQASLKEVQEALKLIGQRNLDLQKRIANFNDISDRLLGYQVAWELGAERRAVRTRSSKKPPPVKTAATAPPARTKPKTQASKADGKEKKGPLLGTASAGGADVFRAGDPLSPPSADQADEAVLAHTASTDFTGTNFAIASQSGNQRSEMRKLEALIKKLIAAAQNGNMDAVVSGLLFLGKRQKILTTNMGAKMLVTMEQYEKYLGGISDKIGALKANDPAYSSHLAQLNGQMNQAAASRQMISQTFRDFLSANEAIDELTHSVVGAVGRTGVSLARFN